MIVVEIQVERERKVVVVVFVIVKIKKVVEDISDIFEENFNQQMVVLLVVEGFVEVRFVEDVIVVLNVSKIIFIDRYLEKRMKVVYNVFEERELLKFKIENFNMRLF